MQNGRTNDGRRRGQIKVPIPTDGTLMSIADVAAYLRLTPAAVRRLLDGRPDHSDGELGERLRRSLFRLSPRRRYILRAPFLAWLREKAGTSGTTPGMTTMEDSS